MSYKYDKHADSQYCCERLASLLLVLGYSFDEFQASSIDDVVNKIRDTYIYKHSSHENSAAQTYIKKQNILLTRNIRRTWFDVQFATHGGTENV